MKPLNARMNEFCLRLPKPSELLVLIHPFGKPYIHDKQYLDRLRNEIARSPNILVGVEKSELESHIKQMKGLPAHYYLTQVANPIPAFSKDLQTTVEILASGIRKQWNPSKIIIGGAEYCNKKGCVSFAKRFLEDYFPVEIKPEICWPS